MGWPKKICLVHGRNKCTALREQHRFDGFAVTKLADGSFQAVSTAKSHRPYTGRLTAKAHGYWLIESVKPDTKAMVCMAKFVPALFEPATLGETAIEQVEVSQQPRLST